MPIALLRERGTLFVGRDIEREREFAVASRRLYLIGFAVLSLLGVGRWVSVRVAQTCWRACPAVTDTSQTIMAGDLSRSRLPVGEKRVMSWIVCRKA